MILTMRTSELGAKPGGGSWPLRPGSSPHASPGNRHGHTARCESRAADEAHQRSKCCRRSEPREVESWHRGVERASERRPRPVGANDRPAQRRVEESHRIHIDAITGSREDVVECRVVALASRGRERKSDLGANEVHPLEAVI